MPVAMALESREVAIIFHSLRYVGEYIHTFYFDRVVAETSTGCFLGGSAIGKRGKYTVEPL